MFTHRPSLKLTLFFITYDRYSYLEHATTALRASLSPPHVTTLRTVVWKMFFTFSPQYRSYRNWLECMPAKTCYRWYTINELTKVPHALSGDIHTSPINLVYPVIKSQVVGYLTRNNNLITIFNASGQPCYIVSRATRKRVSYPREKGPKPVNKANDLTREQ